MITTLKALMTEAMPGIASRAAISLLDRLIITVAEEAIAATQADVERLSRSLRAQLDRLKEVKDAL